MKTKSPLALFSLLVFLAGCTSLQVGGEVQYGRQALLKGSNETALGYFYSAAQKDPNDPTRPLIEAVNMSVTKWGKDDGNCGNTNNDALHRAICSSVAAGVTYVVAAGNDNLNLASIVPATYDEVLTVTAVADYNGEPGGVGQVYADPARCF